MRESDVCECNTRVVWLYSTLTARHNDRAPVLCVMLIIICSQVLQHIRSHSVKFPPPRSILIWIDLHSHVGNPNVKIAPVHSTVPK